MFVTQAINNSLFIPLLVVSITFFMNWINIPPCEFIIFKVDLFLGKIFLRIWLTRKIAKNQSTVKITRFTVVINISYFQLKEIDISVNKYY